MIDKHFNHDITSSFVSSNGISFTGGYYPVYEVVSYDQFGNPINIKENNHIIKSILWGNSGSEPIAFVDNVLPSLVSYTSFESSQKGGWTYTGNPIKILPAKTGSFYYNLSSGAITKPSVPASSSNPYMLTFWARIVSGSGTWVFLGVTENLNTNWKLIRRVITNSNLITIEGTEVLIDELRLLPSNGAMTTFSYRPLVGLTSKTDSRNITVYYEYDSFNRLINIKNENGEILNSYEYNYINY